jgi:heat shock protein HtpX
MAPSEALDERAGTNRALARRVGWEASILPAVVAAVVVAAVLWWLGGVVVGIVVGVVVGAAVAVARVTTVSSRAVGQVLEAVGARPAPEDEFARFHNLIEGLSISNGVEEPGLWAVDSPGANVLAVGPPGAAAVVVTTGLLEHLDRVELEGVLAEALYRIRVHEADLGGQVAVFVCGASLRRAGTADRPLPARRATRVARLLDDRRHLVADISASAMTRFPPGLRDALTQMQETGTAVTTSPAGAAHLWMCDPFPAPTSGAAAERSVPLHPPLQHRIDLLAEL